MALHNYTLSHVHDNHVEAAWAVANDRVSQRWGTGGLNALESAHESRPNKASGNPPNFDDGWLMPASKSGEDVGTVDR